MEQDTKENVNIETGLTQREVEERIQKQLVNTNQQPQTKTIQKIITSNLFTYFNLLNTALALAILIVGFLNHQILSSLKNCLFMGVIFCNTIISIIQEIISKKIIDKLSVLSSTKVCVIRDRKEKQIEIEELVLDDIIKLSIGNQVVTDARIQKGEVEVNESFITGESETLLKKEGDLLLSGSFIVSGNAIAKVEHIGVDNYIAQISREAKCDQKNHTVIMDSFEKILKIISIFIIPIGILFFLSQYHSTENITESIFATVASLIGMIPEGLVLLTSSVMAVSVIRLSKYKVLVQQLYCIETLARVDVICLDKTGTITKGSMKVQEIIEENARYEEISEILCAISGGIEDSSPTIRAIKSKFTPTTTHQKIKEIPFSSKRKFLGVEFEDLKSIYLGSPEFLLKQDFQIYQEKIQKYQKQYRVLVLAKNKEKITDNPKKLEVLGWILIQDEIREDALETLNYFKKEGVEVKIISGDNAITVANIAEKVGLKDLRSIDISTVKEEAFEEIVEKYNIFGRVTPERKKKLVQALKKQGHTVAMTGDGVNDVLALKEADCSIAMASGSDATKNISQLVLLDSNFKSLPQIVKEGRRVINNIERSASLLLSKTIFTVFLVFICIFTSSKYFFIPIQLTLITMFTIGIPSFVLALEPNAEIVKGNFLFKVIGKSLPASLTVVFNGILVMILKYLFHFSDMVTSSLVVFLTATTGFIFLYRICKPFNPLRTILFIFLICGFTYAATIHSSFFNITKLSFSMLLILITLAIFSFYIMDQLSKQINKYLENKLQKMKS